MDLYITRHVCTGEILTAHWSTDKTSAIDAYMASGLSPIDCSTTLAMPEEAAMYRDLDFDGRKAYWVIPLDGCESFAVAADNALDAACCAFDNVGSNNYVMSPVPLTKEEAYALLEPGWDQ